MRAEIIMAGVLLTGCVTVSHVVPAGKDSYMATGGGAGGLGLEDA
jgi:hypothetical protein